MTDACPRAGEGASSLWPKATPMPSAQAMTSANSPTQDANRRRAGRCKCGCKGTLLPRRSGFWRYNERITEDGFSECRLLRLEHHLFAVVALVLEDVVAVRRLVQRQGVGDDEGGI